MILNTIAIRIDNTSNDAFQPDPAFEVARILRSIADRLEDGKPIPFILHDLNGNRCGSVTAAWRAK